MRARLLKPNPDDSVAGGGRTWRAHLALTRINTKLTILKKEIAESLRIEPKMSGVGKCVGYLDLRAFQGERQTGGRSSLTSAHLCMANR